MLLRVVIVPLFGWSIDRSLASFLVDYMPYALCLSLLCGPQTPVDAAFLSAAELSREIMQGLIFPVLIPDLALQSIVWDLGWIQDIPSPDYMSFEYRDHSPRLCHVRHTFRCSFHILHNTFSIKYVVNMDKCNLFYVLFFTELMVEPWCLCEKCSLARNSRIPYSS